MNFDAFQALRRRLVTDHPRMHDAAETNLYRCLRHLRVAELPESSEHVHRCHLAEQWMQLVGLSPESARRAFVSAGIRDALTRLFRYYARTSCRLWLPEDNYPVYLQLAAVAGLQPNVFPTLPEIRWPNESPAEGAAGAELLLITNPLKPQGHWLTADDVGRLMEWVAAGSARRIILDTVYSLQPGLHESTVRLLSTGRVILLHSLTKGWLTPRLFGTAFVPEQDAPNLGSFFRESPPPQSNLRLARELMTRHSRLPLQVAERLIEAGVRMSEALPHLVALRPATTAVSYLFPVRRRWDDLRNEGILGLPASVFGSSRDDITILSSLAYVS